MKKKVFLTYLVIILITVTILGLNFLTKGYNEVESQTKEHYISQARLLGETFTETGYSDREFVDRYSAEYNIRLTIIDADGNVIADSATEDELDNHNNREEVKEALRGNVYSVTRYSSTMGVDYFYVAVPISGNGSERVLRVSLPLSSLETLGRSMTRSLVITIIGALAAALVIAYFFSKYLTDPIEDVTKVAEEIAGGDYGGKIYTRQKDQIGRLADSFNRMSAELSRNVDSLKDRNQELETMLTSISGGLIAIDPMNKILFCNDNFTNVMNLPESIKASELRDKDFYASVRNVALFDVIDRARTENAEYTTETTLIPGSKRFARITATPLPSGDEEEHANSGVLIVIEDITEIKRLENARSEFVSNVTHELKTPLTSIQGFVETLKNGAIKDEKVAAKFLDIIEIETERLSNLIQDTLMLSEIENRGDAVKEPCDVNRITKEAIELVKPRINDKTELIYRPEPYVRPFPGNEARLKELLINLIDNAAKYTEKGSIQVEVKGTNRNLVMKVTDTGIGIPKESQDRIFERFYRVDKGRSRKQGGTGLGLSIVKHIVEMYSGNIEVESEPGKGSSFKIKLPYHPDTV